ncbi:MAG: acyl carrier protein [Clostridia bacterium]|nr:acyl carrier protein [Clostridia bacterium]
MVTIDDLKKIFEAIFESELDVSNISESTALIEDLGMNSIGMLYMALTLEEQYNIKFENSDFQSLKTIGDVIAKIESKVH